MGLSSSRPARSASAASAIRSQSSLPKCSRRTNAPVDITIGMRGMPAMMFVETRLAEAEATTLAVDRRQVLRIACALHGGDRQMPAQRFEHELHTVLGADFGAQFFRARSHLGRRAGRERFRQPLAASASSIGIGSGLGAGVEDHLRPQKNWSPKNGTTTARQPGAQACGRRPGARRGGRRRGSAGRASRAGSHRSDAHGRAARRRRGSRIRATRRHEPSPSPARRRIVRLVADGILDDA